MTDNKDTRSRILEATADLIGRERNLNLTVREIASRAEVNIASVNYYFRSKDKLINEVELLLMENIRSIYSSLYESSLDVRERLIEWSDKLTRHLIDYPGIIYLIGTRILERESTSVGQYLRFLETELAPQVKELTGLEDDEPVGFKVLQLISGIVYPILIYSSDEGPAGIDISNEKVRRNYITSLVYSIEQAPS